MSNPRTPRSFRWMALAVLLAATPLPLAADWQGKTQAKDGVTTVMNPKTSAAAKETVTLEELWRVGGEDDEVLFGVITDIIADDDGNFYMLDSQLTEIQVYDPEGEYLRTIGREGEGPGEFRAAFNLLLLPGGDIGVLQAFPSKLVGLTPDGEPTDAMTLPETEGAGFKMLFQAQNAGDQVAVAYGLNQPTDSGFTQTAVLALVDKKGTKETRLHSQDSTMAAATALIAEKEWDSFRNRWTAGPDGRVYAAIHFGEYAVNVWNPDGTVAHVIRRDYPAHARSAEQMDEVLEIYKGFTRQVPIPNMKFEIEDSWNPIMSIHARDDGTLWVRTSRGGTDQPAGVVGTFDVFDDKGRFMRQVTLKGQGNPERDGYFFVKDRLFVVTDWLNALMALQGGGGAEESDDDAEPMEIISYKLN